MKPAFKTFLKRLRTGLLILACLAAITSRAVVVTTLNQAGLVGAITNGGIATFSTNGTITLTNTLVITTNTTIDGIGHNITISGGGSNGVRVFFVTNNATLTLLNIIIADGKSTNGPGAGIYVWTNCTLTMSNCILTANLAIGKTANAGKDASSRGRAGGSGSAGSVGMGGGIFNQGNVNLNRTTIFGNAASGSNGGAGGNGANAGLFGGAGGSGGSGAPGSGGGIFNAASGTVSITNCTFQSNIAAGGDGGTGGSGGTASFRGKAGAGGKGATASGGAIYNLGSLAINNSTFVTNSAAGGDSAHAGENKNGKAGGAANGGGIFNSGSAFLTNNTLTQNFSAGGKGGGVFSGPFLKGGTGGAAKGGALYNSKGVTNIFCTFATNNVMGGTGGVSAVTKNIGSTGAGSGGSIFRSGGKVFLQNTILAKGDSGAVYSGIVSDGGFNICSDASCKFLKNGTSKTNLNPHLGPLANNGGVAQTMALLTNSPAIDAVGGTNFFGQIDERGIARPQGSACDIGAFEFVLTYSISGKISDGTNGLSGITVSAVGAGTNTAVSQTNGFYFIGGLASGDYLVTPQATATGFTPTSRLVLIGTNAATPSPTNVDFTADGVTPGAFSISGTISEGTNGLSGVTVNAVGAGTSTTASQANGFYFIGGLQTGNYVVAPQSVGAGFTPSNVLVFVGTNSLNPVIGTNATNVNFAANGVILTPVVTNTPPVPGVFNVQMSAIPRQVYKVQVSTNLTTWETISSGAATTNGTFSFADTNNPAVPTRFFRVISTSKQ